MKRRGEKIRDQPVSKKSDVTASTDLRSKIGAKLQTLLNGITADSSYYARSRRHLYEDLFSDGPHSEIIINSNVVVKVEDSDSEDERQIPTQDFLSTAKSRLTELLNKRKNSEKENSLTSTESAPTSVKSKTLQSSTSLNKRSKNSINAESLDTSHSDVLISQTQLQNVRVVLEDIMKSKNRTKFFHLLPKELAKSQCCSTNHKPCLKNQKISLDKHEKNETAKDNHTIIDEVASIHETYDHMDSYVNYDIPTSYQLQSTSCSSETLNFSVNSKVNVSKSSKQSELFLNDYNLAPEVILNVGNGNINIGLTGEDSEAIDDPGVCLNNEAVSSDISHETLIDSDDPDVILLCERRPTYEVITLEEDDSTGDIVEEIQKCFQCGKTFRAKSLLNFHIRMHGSDLPVSELPSSTSASNITMSSSINS